MSGPRIERVIGAVNLGSFRVSAMVAGVTETGELLVLGSAHRAAQGIKRGYVTDMAAATYAVRDAIERFPPELFLRETPLTKPDDAILDFAK